jgi:hypothetical protein
MRPRPPAQLFSGSPLSETLSSAARQTAEMLARWQSDDLLSAAEADVTEQLVRLVTFEMPSLSRSEAFLEPPEEVRLQARDHDGSFEVNVTVWPDCLRRGACPAARLVSPAASPVWQSLCISWAPDDSARNFSAYSPGMQASLLTQGSRAPH